MRQRGVHEGNKKKSSVEVVVSVSVEQMEGCRREGRCQTASVDANSGKGEGGEKGPGPPPRLWFSGNVYNSGDCPLGTLRAHPLPVCVCAYRTRTGCH